jgi:UDP-galactopyranose mutase
MPERFDTLVVGAGYAGSILAERLATECGQDVLVVDRRPHIGGNAYDYVDEHGVLVHGYGPHIFHTNAMKVVDYLSRFTDWRPYEHRVLAQVATAARADPDQPHDGQRALRASRWRPTRRSRRSTPSGRSRWTS